MTLTLSWVVPWPPNSLELDPIENLWALLKRNLRKRWSEEDAGPHSVQELFDQPVEEWNRIPQAAIDKWIGDMPRRMQAVIDADGSYTKW